MVYDELNQTIRLVDLDETKVGSHTIMLTLMDAKGEYSTFEINFELVDTHTEINLDFLVGFNETIEETQIAADFIPEFESEEIVSARVESFSNLGDMVVVFSTKMKSEYINITWINTTFMDLYIVPADDRDKDEGFQLSSVNFTWVVTEYGDWEGQKDPKVSKMVFKLVFLEPLEISPLKVQDSLVLHIKDKQAFFISETLNKDLDDQFCTLETKVTRQMEDTAFTQNFQSSSESGSDGLKGMMLISFLINLVLAGAMSYLVGWINALQLIIHLPMMMILIPANVSMFF